MLSTGTRIEPRTQVFSQVIKINLKFDMLSLKLDTVVELLEPNSFISIIFPKLLLKKKGVILISEIRGSP